jgi:hypothetical protein
MFQLFKARRARRAAISIICPLVERSRWKLHGIPESAWLDPYMVGFLSMLITLVAKDKASNLDVDALGLVQLEAWKEITKLEMNDIGEEICLLSMDHNNVFQAGCDNAVLLFDAIMEPGGASGMMDDSTDELPPCGFPNDVVTALWKRVFEDRIRNIA